MPKLPLLFVVSAYVACATHRPDGGSTQEVVRRVESVPFEAVPEAADLRLKLHVPIDRIRADTAGATHCEAAVHLDPRGTPIDVFVAPTCPEPYAQSIQHTLFKWRWYPARVDGAPVQARTTVRVPLHP